jgi:hypothetical protein
VSAPSSASLPVVEHPSVLLLYGTGGVTMGVVSVGLVFCTVIEVEFVSVPLSSSVAVTLQVRVSDGETTSGRNVMDAVIANAVAEEFLNHL